MEDCSYTVNANRDVAVRARTRDGKMHYFLIPRCALADFAEAWKKEYPLLYKHATVVADRRQRQIGTKAKQQEL